MKHLIVVNGNAGQKEAKDALKKEIKTAFKDLDYEIYETTGPRSVIPFLRDYFKKFTSDNVRVYACGGDGTAHEVMSGLVGEKNAELAIYASGTGNDFVKIYPDRNFKSFADLIKGETKKVDISKLEGPSLKETWYSLNVINFGFDAVVGAVGNKFKDEGKEDPYGKALKVAMLKARFNSIHVEADGQPLNGKKMLLCTVAEGQYVGGKFHCAPKSSNTDGLLDVCLLKIMSFAHLGMIIGTYTEGHHLDKPRSRVVYKQAKEVTITAPKDIDLCVDGEMVRGNSFKISVMPKAINLVIPAKD